MEPKKVSRFTRLHCNQCKHADSDMGCRFTQVDWQETEGSTSSQHSTVNLANKMGWIRSTGMLLQDALCGQRQGRQSVVMKKKSPGRSTGTKTQRRHVQSIPLKFKSATRSICGEERD